MEFQKDTRWEVFLDCNDFASFKKSTVPEIHFKELVPEDVVKSFNIIQKLLLHSYYEYEFYDVAAAKALMTFEMALKIRYEQLTGEEWEKKVKRREPKRDLMNLISWFQNQHYFEVTNDKYLEQVRKVRNSYAHPEKHSYGGPMVRQWIQNPMDLINDLYEDPELREKRKLRQKELIELFSKILESGAILESDSREYIIYETKVVFIDNKLNPEIIYLLFYPIFYKEDLYPEQGVPMYSLIQIATSSIEINKADNTVEIESFTSKKKIKVYPINDLDSKKKYEEWHQYISGYDLFPHLVDLSHEDHRWFSHLRREFHKRD
jgi:hypothetical protein